jgi:hypothetical protein
MHQTCTWRMYMYIRAYSNLCIHVLSTKTVPPCIQIYYMPQQPCVGRWQRTAYMCKIIRVNNVDSVIWKCKPRYCTCCHNSMKKNEPMKALRKEECMLNHYRQTCVQPKERPPRVVEPWKQKFQLTKKEKIISPDHGVARWNCIVT